MKKIQVAKPISVHLTLLGSNTIKRAVAKLNVGTAFIFDGRPYLKMSRTKRSPRGKGSLIVSLTTFAPSYLESDTLVEPRCSNLYLETELDILKIKDKNDENNIDDYFCINPPPSEVS